MQLFRRHHADGTPGALTTALLLCTDRRWDRCTARLIAGIADASFLSVDDLNELAARFLWSDRFRFQYPVSWIGTEWVSIDVTGGGGAVSGPVWPISYGRSVRHRSARIRRKILASG